MVGQLYTGAGESVAHVVFGACNVGVGLGLESRNEVAPAAGCGGEYRCALAVLRGLGERGGDRGQCDGAVVAEGRGEIGQAVSVEERGVGRAVDERRMSQHVDE